MRKLLTIIIKWLAYIAVCGAYAAIAAVAWFSYIKLGVVWSVILTTVLFPVVMLFINLCTLPANALMTWAALRDLEK